MQTNTQKQIDTINSNILKVTTKAAYRNHIDAKTIDAKNINAKNSSPKNRI